MPSYVYALLSAFCLSSAQLVSDTQQPILKATKSPADEVVAKFKNASIIPEVIDAFEPQYLLAVNWTNTTSAQLGNSIAPAILQNPPEFVKLSPASSSGHEQPRLPDNLILALTDPDALSRQDPVWSEVCHLLLYARYSSHDHKPKQIMSYKPPAAPPKTGAHRYVLLVFTPINGTSEKLHLSKPADRKHWGYDGIRVGARRWVKENGLKPLAGNFFYSQNDKQ